jgi:hypothetical protein
MKPPKDEALWAALREETIRDGYTTQDPSRAWFDEDADWFRSSVLTL